MSIKIIPFTDNWINAVADFNTRLSQQGVPFQFPTIPLSTQLNGDKLIYPTGAYYIAVDGEDSVRGAYILQEHLFLMKGREIVVGNMQLPLSEGIINKRYNMIGLKLVQHALEQHDHIYALGMGGMSGPFAKLLSMLKWHMELLPFYFCVIRPFNFLKKIVALRDSCIRRIALDIAAFSGLGYMGLKSYERFKQITQKSDKKCLLYEIQNDFEWADSVWGVIKGDYEFAAVRSSEALRTIYNNQKEKFKIAVLKDKEVIKGWVSFLDLTNKKESYFGSMKVICVITMHAQRGYEAELSRCIKLFANAHGYDIVVGNFSHERYTQALKSNAFFSGPSNVAVAFSPKLHALLLSHSISISSMYLSRGDGDGE